MKFIKYYEVIEKDLGFKVVINEDSITFDNGKEFFTFTNKDLGILKRYNINFYTFFEDYRNEKVDTVLKYAKRHAMKIKFVETNNRSELDSLNYLASLKVFQNAVNLVDTQLQKLIYLNLLVIDLGQEDLFDMYDITKEQFYTKHDIYSWFDYYDNFIEEQEKWSE